MGHRQTFREPAETRQLELLKTPQRDECYYSEDSDRSTFWEDASTNDQLPGMRMEDYDYALDTESDSDVASYGFMRRETMESESDDSDDEEADDMSRRSTFRGCEDDLAQHDDDSDADEMSRRSTFRGCEDNAPQSPRPDVCSYGFLGGYDMEPDDDSDADGMSRRSTFRGCQDDVGPRVVPTSSHAFSEFSVTLPGSYDEIAAELVTPCRERFGSRGSASGSDEAEDMGRRSTFRTSEPADAEQATPCRPRLRLTGSASGSDEAEDMGRRNTFKTSESADEEQATRKPGRMKKVFAGAATLALRSLRLKRAQQG